MAVNVNDIFIRLVKYCENNTNCDVLIAEYFIYWINVCIKFYIMFYIIMLVIVSCNTQFHYHKLYYMVMWMNKMIYNVYIYTWENISYDLNNVFDSGLE